MEFDLEEYRAQKQLRQKRRKELISRFEVVKAKLTNKPIMPSPSIIHHNQSHQSQPAPTENKPQKVVSNLESDLTSLEAENKSLKEQLAKAEEKSSHKLGQLKKEIMTLKEGYLKEMEEITQISNHEKSQAEKKMKSIITQIKQAQAKNEQIQSTNKALKEEAVAGQKLFQTYLTDIEKQYKDKLVEFEQILKDSREKIEDMEKNFNEQELVDNALKNPKLMEAVLSSGKSEISTSKEEYENILKSKTEIVEERISLVISVMNNSKLKEGEIKRIKQLTDKFKTMFETLNAEKKQLVEDNVSMTNELLEIKNLFTQTLGDMGGEDEADEDQEDNDEQGDQEEKAEATN